MITIRKASLESITTIRFLAQKTWYETYQEILSAPQMDYMFDMMYSTESLTRQMSEDGHAFFIAYESEKPLGYVSVEKQREDLFHLHKLYVLPSGQHKGIGKMLLHKVYEYAGEHAGADTFAVELNMNRDNKALHFYERMGMRIHDQGDFHIGNGYYMNDYILRIDLKK
jgi:diamine N-acetyltransferase